MNIVRFYYQCSSWWNIICACVRDICRVYWSYQIVCSCFWLVKIRWVWISLRRREMYKWKWRPRMGKPMGVIRPSYAWFYLTFKSVMDIYAARVGPALHHPLNVPKSHCHGRPAAAAAQQAQGNFRLAPGSLTLQDNAHWQLCLSSGHSTIVLREKTPFVLNVISGDILPEHVSYRICAQAASLGLFLFLNSLPFL